MANKYLFLYSGGNPPKSEAEGKAVMSAWMAWFGKVGPNVVDGGAPFAPGAKTVGGASPSQASGYSIIMADSLGDPGFCIKNLKFPVGLGESRR